LEKRSAKKASDRSPAVFETAVGFLILGILACTGVWVYFQQSIFNPAVDLSAKLTVPGATPLPSPMPQEQLVSIPQEVAILSPVEDFSRETLSDKINGKAELYLPAGFNSLKTQRFHIIGTQNSWFEMFVYDMGNTKNAFAVFSSQRREPSTQDSTTRFSYLAENAMFFVHGGFYVEILGSESSEEMLRAFRQIASRFVQSIPAVHEDIPELKLFPKDGLVSDGITLIPSNAFGFDAFNDLFTARYILAEIPFTAFISKRSASEEASALAEAYAQFLLDFGGTLVKWEPEIPRFKCVEILGSYEIIFSLDNYLGGVHEAPELKPARMLAEKLYEIVDSRK
jgi:hypothetical protein